MFNKAKEILYTELFNFKRYNEKKHKHNILMNILESTESIPSIYPDNNFYS